ncbi:hypothetical protein Tco_0536532 [Tanacetum coccineum]
MSSASSAVTYTFVYTDSKPGRVFWGADEEISDGGIPRVIVLGYDGLPMQPVAPPSPDYIPGPEDPQTPPVPQDEDERKPMMRMREHRPVIPPPSTDITFGAKEDYPSRHQASISLPPKAERLIGAWAPPTHYSPPCASPFLNSSGCLIQNPDTSGSESIRHIIDAVNCRITYTSLPHYTISIHATTDDHMRSGQIRAEAVPEIAPMTVGEVNTRVVGLVSPKLSENQTRDLYALLEDDQDSRSRIS